MLRLTHPRALWSLAALAVLAPAALGGRSAYALVACTSADIVSQDPGCPNSAAPCRITKAFTVSDGCIFDFGSRDVTIANNGGKLDVGSGATTLLAANLTIEPSSTSGRVLGRSISVVVAGSITIGGLIDVGSGNMTLLAGSLTVAPGGTLEGIGSASSPPGNAGGTILIRTAGDVTIQKSGFQTGKMDVSAKGTGGQIAIEASGAVTIAGTLNAGQVTNAANGGGGSIRITTCGAISGPQTGALVASTGYLSPALGDIDLYAGGNIDFRGQIDVGGANGGSVRLQAETSVTLGTVNGNADTKSDAGSGGEVEISAGTSVQLLGPVTLNGAASIFDYGGDGGVLSVSAAYGDVTVSGNVALDGVFPDGSGGDVALVAQGSIATSASISAKSSGIDSAGGVISLEADRDVTTDGIISASGGSGGDLSILAGRHLTVAKNLSAAATSAGGFGGTIQLDAGADGSGNLSVQATVDVGAVACALGECGEGGETDLSGCDIAITATGSLLARGPDGGAQSAVASEQLTIAGQIDARKTGGADFADGDNSLSHPSRKVPLITGTVLPAPALAGLATCTAESQNSCLPPCPSCGNDVTEFPETCDDGTGASCAGCSFLCRIENCDDQDPLTVDSCTPNLGCRNQSAPPPCGLTPTPTATATRTRTPSSSPTPTRPTPTRTATPVATATPSPTPSPTGAGTATPSPTSTPAPCVADCNGDQTVTINEVVASVNIFLGEAVAVCANADQDGNGQVAINEVVAAVNSFLAAPGECPRVQRP